jgi:hypothetical protein
MATVLERRGLLISWRPSEGSKRLGRWVDRFLFRLRLEEQNFTVTHSQQPGHLAALRDKHYNFTDFVSVVTIDYVQQCRAEPYNELRDWAIPYIERGAGDIRFWACRLDPAPPSQLGLDSRFPWRDPHPWHLLPGDNEHMNVALADQEDLDEQIEFKCIVHLRGHSGACPVCRRARPPEADTGAAGGLLSRFVRLFHRS